LSVSRILFRSRKARTREIWSNARDCPLR